MMSDLLDALTSKNGDRLPLTISNFDMATLAREVSEEYCQSGDANIETRLETIQGHWCRGSMRRALENLVNNALKYGDGGAVSIEAAQTQGRLVLSVRNTGAPISKERHGAIFDYLTREAATMSTIGWGVGLPFVKRVAESHGGSVAVDSSAETGTTFLIDLPVDCRPYVENVDDRSAARV